MATIDQLQAEIDWLRCRSQAWRERAHYYRKAYSFMKTRAWIRYQSRRRKDEKRKAG